MRIWRLGVVVSTVLLCAPLTASAQTLVRDVRAAIARNDVPGAAGLVSAYRASAGTTPEALAALSWVGRGALAAKDYFFDDPVRKAAELVANRRKTITAFAAARMLPVER